MKFEELCIPFPCTDALWNTQVEDCEAALEKEPAGRASSPYSIQCIWALSRLSPSSRLNLPGYVTIHDFEIGICSMQARLWEETQHPAAYSNRVATNSTDGPSSIHGYGQSWPVLLGIWRVTMEQFRISHKRYCDHESEQETYLTSLLLYHASLLRVYVDMPLLRRLAKSYLQQKVGSNQLARRELEMKLHDWSRSTKAKDALWHAAQILRLHRELSPMIIKRGIPISNIAADCLFRAGLVAWAMSRSSLNCGLCRPASKSSYHSLCDKVPSMPVELELTTIGHLSTDYEAWMEISDSKPLINGINVCACRLIPLVEMFRNQIGHATVGSALFGPYCDALDQLKQYS